MDRILNRCDDRHIDRHNALISELNTTTSDLAAYCAKKDVDWGTVLLAAIDMQADDDTLQHIIDDLRDFMRKVAEPSRSLS